jgi:hypothetical protein
MRSVSAFRRLVVVLAAASAWTLVPAPARAQNEAEATRLFSEGKDLMAAGKLEEACVKFEGSLKAGAGTGAMLYLGDCYERTARPSSAYEMYRGAETLAHSHHDQREGTAHQLAEKIRPHVSWLRLRFAAPRGTGYELRRDGSLLADTELDGPIPIDPGPHALEARAPGKLPFRTTFRVDGEAANVSVAVPALADAPKDTVVVTRTSGRTQRAIGATIAGVGLAGIAVASALGGYVLWEDGQAETAGGCDPVAKTCTPGSPGNNMQLDARNIAHVVDVTMAVGVAALIGGVIVYLVAPKNHETHKSVVSVAGPGMLRISF